MGVVQGTLSIQQVVNVWTLANLADLITVDYSLEVLLFAVKGQSLRLTVYSIMIVFLRETVLVVPNGVAGGVTQDLDESVLELDLSD